MHGRHDHRVVIDRADRPYLPPTGSPHLLLVSAGRASGPLMAHLSHHGFSIDLVASATGAAEAVAGRRPDVVLIDASVEGGWERIVGALGGEVAAGHIAVLAPYWSAKARRIARHDGIGATLLQRVEGSELVHRLRALASEQPD